MWTAKGEKVTELPTTGVDVGTLHVFDKELYAGDEGGNVCIYLSLEYECVHTVYKEVTSILSQRLGL